MQNCVRKLSAPVLASLFLASWPLGAQVLSVGAMGGVPLTHAFETASSGPVSFFSDTKRYVVGPTAEFHLPFGMGIEFDALYRRLGYESTDTAGGSPVGTRTTANSWEFPLLLKFRGSGPGVRPFLDGGASFRRLSDLKYVRDFFTGGTTTETNRPPELENRFAAGFVVGGGLEFGGEKVRVAPQARYTRWGARHFRDVTGLLLSNQDQADFLLGITF